MTRLSPADRGQHSLFPVTESPEQKARSFVHFPLYLLSFFIPFYYYFFLIHRVFAYIPQLFSFFVVKYTPICEFFVLC